MADCFVQFSCSFDVGSAENVARAIGIRGELAAEMYRDEGGYLGFEMEADHEQGPRALWIHSDEYGEPDRGTLHLDLKPPAGRALRFAAESGFRRLATILVRGRMDQTAAIGTACAEPAKRGREFRCVDIRIVRVPRVAPLLDAICRRHTGFASFLDLLTAPSGYWPSIHLHLMGCDGAVLARAYDRVQARWGDRRRAFVTGHLVRRRARTP